MQRRSRWGVAGAVAVLAVVVGCGPALGNPDTGGGGSGNGSGDGGGSSGGEDTEPLSPACPQVLVSGTVGATSPVIKDGYGYWAHTDGTVWRVELGVDSEGPEPVVAPVERYTSLLVDDGRVLLVAAETLSWHVLADATTSLLMGDQQSPFSPALSNDRLLWLNYGSGILAGSLMSVPVDAPSAEAVVLLDQLGTPQSLAADASAAYVIADRAPDLLQGALLEIDPLTGATVALASDMDNPGSLALTSDRVIWVEHGLEEGAGRVRAISKGGGQPAQTLVTVDEGMPVTVAADDASIYYGVFGASQAAVLRLDAASDGAPIRVGTWPKAVVDIAVSPAYVLVTANPVDTTTGPLDSVTVFCRD